MMKFLLLSTGIASIVYGGVCYWLSTVVDTEGSFFSIWLFMVLLHSILTWTAITLSKEGD